MLLLSMCVRRRRHTVRLRISRELILDEHAAEAELRVRACLDSELVRHRGLSRNAVKRRDRLAWSLARVEQSHGRAWLTARHLRVVVHEEHWTLHERRSDQGRLPQIDGCRLARRPAIAAREAGIRMVHVSRINALGLGRLNHPADEESGLPGIVEIPYVVTKREAAL